jgi:dTDP-4-dehydrorhamnose reductase
MARLKDMRILITGVQGQVGYELVKALGLTGAELVLAGRRIQTSTLFQHKAVHLDLQDSASVRDCLLSVKPQLLINPAAYTAVDKAETETDSAFQINCHAVEVMGQTMRELGGGIIHFSTDYVYNPEHQTPIGEDDEKSPPNVYAISKWAGEEALRQTHVPHVILRTSWVYGIQGQNFVKTMLRLGREREQLRIVGDQIGSPSSAANLAQAVFSLLLLGAKDPIAFLEDYQGAYNLADEGYTSWHDFAQEVFRFARDLGMELKVKEVLSILSAEYPTPAKRPLNSRLKLAKFKDTFGLYPKSWQTSLQEFMHQATLSI